MLPIIQALPMILNLFKDLPDSIKKNSKTTAIIFQTTVIGSAVHLGVVLATSYFDIQISHDMEQTILKLVVSIGGCMAFNRSPLFPFEK